MADAQTVRSYHPILALLIVLSSAAFIVLAISKRTNSLPPKWDTEYYVDMAENGIAGNQ